MYELSKTRMGTLAHEVVNILHLDGRAGQTHQESLYDVGEPANIQPFTGKTEGNGTSARRSVGKDTILSVTEVCLNFSFGRCGRSVLRTTISMANAKLNKRRTVYAHA